MYVKGLLKDSIWLRFRGTSSKERFPIDGKSGSSSSASDYNIDVCKSQGYTEVRYDEEKKRVVYEPLQLAQAFRYVKLL